MDVHRLNVGFLRLLLPFSLLLISASSDAKEFIGSVSEDNSWDESSAQVGNQKRIIDQRIVEAPSPSSSLTTVLPSDQCSSIVSHTHISDSPPLEQLGEKSDKTKAVVTAVIITAISTLALAGVFSNLYKKFAPGRHRSNEQDDDRHLLTSSIDRASFNHSCGELNVSKYTGNSHKVSSSETGRAECMQLLSLNRGKHRTISLPSDLGKCLEILDIQRLTSLPKTQPSPVELSDRISFNSRNCSSTSLRTIQNLYTSASKRDISLTQPSQEVLQISSTFEHPSSADSPLPLTASQNTSSQPIISADISHHCFQSIPSQLSPSCEPPLSSPPINKSLPPLTPAPPIKNSLPSPPPSLSPPPINKTATPPPPPPPPPPPRPPPPPGPPGPPPFTPPPPPVTSPDRKNMGKRTGVALAAVAGLLQVAIFMYLLVKRRRMLSVVKGYEI